MVRHDVEYSAGSNIEKDKYDELDMIVLMNDE